MRGSENCTQGTVYKHRLVVPNSVIDANEHANNVAYVQWMQDAAVAHFTSVGGAGLMRSAGGTWVARVHHIEYLKPAFEGDRLEVRTWVESFARVRSTRRYEFVRSNDRTLLARGETEWIFIDAESGRPTAIPESIRNILASSNLQDGET